MANQTGVRPDTVSTDTACASEIVFALAWTLGYRYAPRLADLADHRLWRIDPGAAASAGERRRGCFCHRFQDRLHLSCRLVRHLFENVMTGTDCSASSPMWRSQ
jgi:TnpA family transposase